MVSIFITKDDIANTDNPKEFCESLKSGYVSEAGSDKCPHTEVGAPDTDNDGCDDIIDDDIDGDSTLNEHDCDPFDRTEGLQIFGYIDNDLDQTQKFVDLQFYRMDHNHVHLKYYLRQYHHQ
jgi:hypothetical protein